MPEPLIDIRPDHWDIVRGILRKNVPQYDVWAFGSRAKWTAKAYSDFDLAVITEKPLSLATSAALADDFSESDLPWKVDVVDWAGCSESFREVIRRDRVVVQQGEKTAALGMAGEGYSNPSPLPLLPTGWHVATVEELCNDVTSGGTPLRSNADFFVGGRHDWFKTGELKDSVLLEADEKITDKALERSSAKLFPKDTVLMAMYGDGNTITSLGILANEAATNQACCAMLADRAVCEPRFLFYVLRFHRDDFIRLASGGAQRNLSGKLIRRFALNVPPLPEQRTIAHILGTLDDKIELNRRMNETLEALARALFKSWFVDFDPVRAKAEGRDHGLPKSIANIFPNSFEDSELGKIPKGWKPSRVGKHFSLTMGQSPPGSTYNESGDGLPFFQGRTDFGFRFPSRRVFCTAPTRLAKVGDTLVSVRAPVGYVNIAIEACAVGRGVAAVRHHSGSRSFTYHAMHNLGEHFGKFEGEGTVFGSINKADFERLPFVAPPKAVLDCFEHLASPIDDRVESNEVESRTLTALRDSLLPKLISGELRVKDVKRQVEAAAA
ncbi:MAG: restriction endonuclease subunit S [Pseudomonadota bacterium]